MEPGLFIIFFRVDRLHVSTYIENYIKFTLTTQSMINSRARFSSNYKEAYDQLNPKQKEAVDHIEGPVLVNAGPGTGKTQILATRIGKILIEQDVSPHNILCLTYTDSATIAMRKRLVKIIGPEAHQIYIYTFHGFCNQVIQENLEYFGGYRKLEPISDLERVNVMEELIDGLDDDSPLKRYKGDRYYEAVRMRKLFVLMKKENISPEQMHKMIDEYIENEKDKEEYYYKRKYTNKKTGKTYEKGDLKEDSYNKLIRSFDIVKAAVDQYIIFLKLMQKYERYDYEDMILWVIKAFSENEEILLKYQERYQYFLVDEYQDTNGAQNEILNYLISYWDVPNVFVVGDDDQAIYKFQGANLGNIIDFQKKYNPNTIVLENNYRSNQMILDMSKSLIEYNQERIVNQIKDLSKELIASSQPAKPKVKPRILSFDKQSAEYAFLAKELHDTYHRDKDKFNNIAIIYRKHAQVDDLVNVLEKKNVPINIKRRINILELPFIRNVINILSYLREEYKLYGLGEGRIFEILHYNYFGIDSVDIGKLSMYCQKSYRKAEESEKKEAVKWRDLIADEETLATLGLKNADAIKGASTCLDKWIKDMQEVTLQQLFENIINEGHILEYVMTQSNKSWLLQVLSTFFDFIKNESTKKPDLSIEELLTMLDKMKSNKIELPVNKVITSAEGAHFITAHSSKGLEFEKVYIIGGIKDIWDKGVGTNQQYKYPDTVNADSETNIEDERRLFYVAMTRAETDLLVTYSQQNENGKELGKSQFIDEIMATYDIEIEAPKLEEDTIAEFYYNLLKKEDKVIPLIEKDLIDKWIDSYSLSVTHLNKYLKCPISFYFEAILKVPHARNAYSGFGTAMHGALHHFFLHINKTGEAPLDNLLFHFRENMKAFRSNFTDKEYESFMTHGLRSLEALHAHKIKEWSQGQKFAVEAKLENAEYKGIPIKGFIDKIEIYKDYVHVVDYKTGDPTRAKTKQKLKAPSEKDPNGGDYWRQIVFYKILMDSDKKENYNMVTGEVDFIEPNAKTGEFSNSKYAVQPEEMEMVGTQIVETVDNIKNYKFDTTCADEDCMWCNFVKDNYTINAALKEDIYEHE